MKSFCRFYLPLAALFLGALTTATAAGPTNVFFPFCIDWHDAKKRGFEEQAHAPDESCPVDHLVKAAAFYTCFPQAYCASA